MLEEILSVINERQRKTISMYRLYWLLMSIRARHNKYKKIWLSKKEKHNWISEWVLWWIIQTLNLYWFLKKIWTARNKNHQVCNVYEIWQDFLNDFINSMRNYSHSWVKSTTIWEKIENWCIKTNIIDFIKTNGSVFWIKFLKERQKMIEKWVYTNWKIIRDFKNWESYNLFNFLKLKTWYNVYDLAKKLSIIW
jgi:hypothetical protein